MRGLEPSAARADEERIVGAELDRAEREVVLDRLAHDGEHRHHAGLVAFARDAQHIAAA